MENEVKQRNQRNRRRERAQRMQAQRESKVKDGDSGEDESPAREKPPRPPARRKKSREPLGEEDIIDGFAIMAFRTYEDLEAAVKCVSSPRTPSLTSKPRLPLTALPSDATRHPPNNVNSHGITLLLDAGTSDDSGRASERLTGSSVAPRDPDSSRDRLSDASSRCSSGKGYICDSEGDDDKASPDNSRNGSPEYHDASMEDVSDAGPLFRMTGASVGGGKNELVARGGSGGALALSRAPVGGSASPAPAPLPQPAPSPAPAALPPPALPPPAFRAADTPHRQNGGVGAHIPAVEIPARPVGAAGPEQAGARATADSPTPAPPAPSPLFPSHAAYHAHAALPDYRHTNHETRTESAEPAAPAAPVAPAAPAPLNLHAHHRPAARPAHVPDPAAAAHPSLPDVPHSQPHPVMPGHDVRNAQATVQSRTPTPASYPDRIASIANHINGVSHGALPHSAQTMVPSGLPNRSLPARPLSPNLRSSRSYPAPPIGSSHINSNISSSIHNHIPYQNQISNLQKHSAQPVYNSRPTHLTPFSVANHLTNHIPTTAIGQMSTQTQAHTVAGQPLPNHTMHLPSITSSSLSSHTNSNIGLPPTSLPSALTGALPNFSHSHKHPGLSLPPHPSSMSGLHPSPPASMAPVAPIAPAAPTTATTTAPATESPAPAATATAALPTNGYPAPAPVPPAPPAPPVPPAAYAGTAYPPLYAPYATSLQHTPYLPPAAASPRNTADTRTSLSASPLVAPKTPKGVRPHTPGSTGAAGAAGATGAVQHAPHTYSPRGHSPTRERDSYSSNISSLSRASVGTPVSAMSAVSAAAVVTSAVSAPLAAPTPTPAAPAPTHLAHSLAPVPTVSSISAKPPAHWGVTRAAGTERAGGYPGAPLFGAPLPPPNPNPFSAESLFQTSPGADLLRRELDNRFLAAAGAAGVGSGGVGGGAPGAFSVRTEMHHHQHQHTHVHQHPPPHPHHHQLYVPHHHSLFKDVGKLPLYRGGLGLGYPYSSSLLHPAAPYVPPAPLSTYPPKPVVPASSESATKPPRPAVVKTGKWNAMHVRIAWEIYNHQQKEKSSGGVVGVDKDKLRGFPAPPAPPAPAPPYRSPYELPPSPYLPQHHPHLGMSPFARYGAGAFPSAPPPSFALSAYGRELALSSSLHGAHHPAALWGAPRAPQPPPPSAVAVAEARREHEERERARREREERERERRDKEERERRKREREREIERARHRSPLRTAADAVKEERGKEPTRAPLPPPAPHPPHPPHPHPPPLSAYPPPPAWDPYRGFDPLQHMRFTPLVEAAIRAEEDRAKMLSAYAAHHHHLKTNPLLHRGLPPHASLAPLAPPHASLAPLAPLPPLAPLAPLDLLKKEEPR